jgi:hypothetical protein
MTDSIPSPTVQRYVRPFPLLLYYFEVLRSLYFTVNNFFLQSTLTRVN